MRNYLMTLVAMLLMCPTISAIGLTEFSKQLINLYDRTYSIHETEDTEFSLYVHQDSLTHLFISASDPKCPWDGTYLGPISYNGFAVYLFGQPDSLIYYGESKYSIRPSDEPITGIMICDPIEWEIIINENLKLDKQLTNGMDSAILVQLERIVSTHCGK